MSEATGKQLYETYSQRSNRLSCAWENLGDQERAWWQETANTFLNRATLTVENPTTMMAAIALSPGNKAKAVYGNCFVVVQEMGRHQFRWWSLDQEDTNVWENVRDRETFLEHLSTFGLKHDAPIWYPVR